MHCRCCKLILLLGCCAALCIAQTSTAATTMTVAATTGAPTTTAPAAVSVSAVNPLVVGIGVIAVLLLLAAGGYYIFAWPKRSLLAYRRSFEEKVNRDRLRGEQKEMQRVAQGLGGGLYSGAKSESKKIPNFRDIEEARKLRAREEEELKRKLQELETPLHQIA